MNEDVLDMIDTLHARLDDVRAAVEALHGEATGYAKRLDRLDDSLYLIQRELEAMEHASASSEDVDDEEGAAPALKPADEGEKGVKAAGDADSKKGEIFTDDMKENLADAGRALGNIYRDGKEVVSELSGTMGELKDVFSFGKKRH